MIADTLRTILVLGRVSNLPTVWTNIAVGWFLCEGAWNPELAWIILGMSLVYVAGMTLNDAFDTNWDREHAASRPIPAGKIRPSAVWILGFVEMLSGVLILLTLTTVHPLLTGFLVLAVFLYNALHKRWAGSVLIMGLCRAVVYLGAASAALSLPESLTLPITIYLISGAVVLYIAGLTLAARSEHLKSKQVLPLLPRLLLMLPVLFPLFSSRSIPVSMTVNLLTVAGIAIIWCWLVFMRKKLRERIPSGISLAIAGIALYDSAVVVFDDWPAAVFCLACFGLTLVSQRFVPAT